MLKPFQERVNESVIVCDGAMGTQLYAKGVFLNRCFDELNLSRPSLVREVHQEYLWAGAEILETNTFGANRIKLDPHGLADRVRDINLSGVRIAKEIARESVYIGGSVGPLGIRVEPLGKLRMSDAEEIFAEQIQALVESGVDLICLETFSDLSEIEAALRAARRLCSLPIMAQLTLEDDGNSLDGTPPETFGPLLERLGADIIGANCGVGPQVMLESIERMAGVVTRKLVAQPNAGKPRNFEGRNLYLSSPEYLASYARRFIKAGVQVVGGCCGTTPAHIKAIRGAVQALKSKPVIAVSAPARTETARIDEFPAEDQSRLRRLIEDRKPVVIVGLIPPRGVDPAEALDAARALKAAGADAIGVSETPRAGARMGALALAVLIEREEGIESILHYACRDRHLLAMQSELLGAYAIGLRNLILSDGEPIRIGDYIDATSVFDVDSVGLAHLVASLNRGRDLGGKSIGKPTGFYTGVSVNPSALNLEEEIRRLKQKADAGARFAITEPVFQPDSLERFVESTQFLAIPLIAGIRVLASCKEAEFLSNEVPGMAIPESILGRMRSAGSAEKERMEGVAIAREIMRQVRDLVQGVEISPSGGPYTSALKVLSKE